MKFCPHCGLELTEPTEVACPSCGGQLNMEEIKRKKEKKHRKQKSKKEKSRKKVKTEKIPEIMGEAVDDGYDGYYNDVLPPDMDRISEGMDKELIKKIALLVVGVVLVIGACIVMMYTL